MTWVTPFASRGRQRLGHARFVDVVRTRERNGDDHRRKRRGAELRHQQLLAHAVHADAAKRFGDGRQRADDLVVAGAAHFVQCKRAVLAARPCDQCFRARHRIAFG